MSVSRQPIAGARAPSAVRTCAGRGGAARAGPAAPPAGVRGARARMRAAAAHHDRQGQTQREFT